VSRQRVLVLCGGRSAEHEVSLVSARTVLDHLNLSRYDSLAVVIDDQGRWRRADAARLPKRVSLRAPDPVAGQKVLAASEILSRLKADSGVVFPVLHGPFGEDGSIQGLLETAGVAYVGSGVLGSALGMDKEATKKLAALAKIPILDYRAARDGVDARSAAKILGYPLFVKPARLGSSVGVAKVEKPSQLAKALSGAFRYDDKILLEKGIAAREIECALLGDPWPSSAGDPLALRVSDCGEIVPKENFYDYRSKYLDPQGARLLIPAPISPSTSSQIKKMALAAFVALDSYGMARADFLLDKKTGRVYFNEINTIPGFTSSSMYPLLWKREGLETGALIGRLIELALRRHRRGLKLKIKP